MHNRMLLSATALRTVAAISLISLAGGQALAQTGTSAAPTPASAATGQDQSAAGTPEAVVPQTQNAQTAKTANDRQAIVVTGSRIRRPNLESIVPVTSLAGDQIFQRGQTNVGEALNDLPQLRSTFSQQNPGLGIGIAGLNLLDLRGLGTARTLVLVNGRRHVAADILNNAVSPDVNSIPADLIDRVDIVTGGNSAVYGSDAIAGVVNFILKRNFDGLQIRAQGAVAGADFGPNSYVSAMFGKNFADGRGNVILQADHAYQERVFASDVPWFHHNNGLVVQDVDVGGLPNGSDNYPDRTFMRDIRSASINRFGLIPITQPLSNPQCGIGIGATNGPPSTVGGSPYNCTFIFTPDGQLVPQTGTRIGQGIIGTIIGGNGQTGREGDLVSVMPKQDRINLNLLAHYTVSDAFEPFIEAKWNRTDTLGSNAGPSFIQGTFGQFDIRERVRLDNPFLTPAQRTTIANAILASGCNTSLTAACSSSYATRSGQGIQGRLSASDIAMINAGTYRFVDARLLDDAGIRDEKFRRDTYRIVVGARGSFLDDWGYEVSANYGKFTEDTTTYGYLNRQRFLLSLDSGRNPVTGQIQCRAQFDPTAAVAFAGQGANLASDIAACVPYNPFGAANNTAAVNYFKYNARDTASLSQLDFLGFVNGNSARLFELPGGPVSFVIGAEHREEKARYHNDPFIESGATNAVVIGEFVPPTFKVTEGFGEINIPLLKDMPFVHELTASGAGRVSSYGGAVGTVWTFNAGGEWSPIRDIRFRGNYGKAIRAPNSSETGFPVVPNFAPGFLDPCASGQIANNPSRTQNCQTDLGALLGGLPNVTYSLPILSGSNPDLKPETSYSLTLGAVVTPRWIPGFSLSVDYYNIKVENVIVSLSAQTIANSCYDQPTLSNPFCAMFTRWRGPGVGPLGEQPGQILGNSLLSAGINFAKRVRRGIDVNANYTHRLGGDTRFNTSLIYTHGLKSSNYENPTIPTFENRILSELGDPQDEFRLDNDLQIGKLTIGYRMHYIGPMYVNAYEDFNALPSACTPAGCPPNNADYADIKQYPAVFYHDIRLQWDTGSVGIAKNIQMFVGIDNILNRHPPLGTTATGSGSAIYDFWGRHFYAGLKANF